MEIIHIVLGKANPDRLNGVNKVVYNLALEQSKAGKNVQVWGITQHTAHDYPSRNFHTVLFKKKRFPLSISNALKEAILAHKDAVFHLHGGWVPTFSRLAGFMAKNKVKYVITPHGAYNKIAMKRSALRKALYFFFFEKKVLSRAYRVHSIGRSEVEGLRKLFPSAPSFLLVYGFEPGLSLPAYNKNSFFTIGYVGRLDIHTKGLDLLMQAFRLFQKDIQDSRLWIIGDGAGTAYLEHCKEKMQLQNVVLWGKKFGAEKNELISKMHVFAHPSRNEGLPSAVLEAAALGIPTIVSEATNMAEYVNDYGAGIAIADENVEQLLQAMHTLYQAYQNGNSPMYIAGAKRMLNDAFSWSGLVEKYDALYS